MNAIKHGLLSKQVVLQCEDAAEFSHFRQAILAALKPVGPLETECADRAAILAWRRRRCPKLEAALFDNLASEEIASNDARAEAFAKATVTLANLARYERQLSGDYSRTLDELDRRQATRAGEPVPPPAGDLDIDLTMKEQVIAAMEDAQADDGKRSKEELALKRLKLEHARVDLRTRELQKHSEDD